MRTPVSSILKISSPDILNAKSRNTLTGKGDLYGTISATLE
jgi:hypothetical protein